MNPKQFVIVDFEGGFLGWAGLALMAATNIYAMWFLLRQFWRTKFGSAFAGILVAAVLGLPDAVHASDPMEPYLSFLGITLEETTLEQARAKLGGPKAVFNGGDAAAGACAQCYVGSDGTTLALMSDAEMGSCTTITTYELLQNESMGTYSSLAGYVTPKEKRPKCSKLKRLSRATLVGGKLKLGMTEAQVTRVLGKPSGRTANLVVYESEVPMKMTKEDAARLKQGGPWVSARSVVVEFAEGRVTAISVTQITSD